MALVLPPRNRTPTALYILLSTLLKGMDAAPASIRFACGRVDFNRLAKNKIDTTSSNMSYRSNADIKTRHFT